MTVTTEAPFLETIRKYTRLPVEDGANVRTAYFNAEVEGRARALVRCRGSADVGEAIRIAADHGVPVSVLAGGHDLTGRALGRDGLVLDLRSMCEVRFDAERREVTVGGGALTRHLLDTLPQERVTVTGTISSVGVTGLTLGGGYGRLNSRFGLAIDCMKRAQVVLADGREVTASEDADADLFWALRGGGSGFGVVTAMTMATFHAPKILTATIFVPLQAAKPALLHYQHMLAIKPDELSIFAAFMTAPSGEPGFFMMPMWSADAHPSAGERWLQEVAKAEGAQVLFQGWSTYRDTFDEEVEKSFPKGGRYCLHTQNLARIDESAAELLVAGAKTLSSPRSAIVLHDLHGVPTRIAPDATAFPLRQDHIMVEIIAAWGPNPDDDGSWHRVWAKSVAAELAMVALPGGYVNLLGPRDGVRVRAFYGASQGRLAAIKARVDPHDVFDAGTGRLES